MDASGLRVEQPTRMRAAIARRMSASKREAPHFYVTTEIALDEAEALRASLDVRVTALLARACTLALRENPRLNALWTEDGLAVADDVNLGIAVALEDGLVAPALLRADALDLHETAAALDDLVARARASKLRPAELGEATFTLSNLGMFDVTSFTAILNPPQVGILATGRVLRRPRFVDGELRERAVLNATLSADHRAVDGAEAARFLESFKDLLESPDRLAEKGDA